MLGSQTLAAPELQKQEAAENEASQSTYPLSDQYLLSLFFWICIWAVLLLGFIWTVDPYGVSPIKMTMNGFNRYKPERLDLDRLIKPLEVWRYQPKTIFIGTSRMQQSLDPAVFADTPFAPAYNAAIPASTLMVNADNIEYFLKLDPQIKHIFLELFLYNFTQLLLDTSPHTWGQFVNNAASLELSSDAFRDTLKTVYINRLIEHGKEPRPAYIAAGGYRVPKEDFDPADTFNDALFMQNVSAWNRSAHLTLDDAAFKPLDRIVALAREHGVQLHFILTPNYPWDDYRLLTLGYWPLLEKWLRKLASYSDVASFSQYNQLITEAPTHRPRMTFWNDPIHFSLAMGQKILKTYVSEDKNNIPANFRRELNPQTVEAIIAERRAGVLQWAAKHPDFVMDFEDAKLATDSVSGNLDLITKTLQVNDKKYPLALGAGEVAFTQTHNNSFGASGWAVDDRAQRPPRLLVATRGDKVIAQSYATVKRPDLALAFNKKELTSGFSIEIPFAKEGSSEPIRIFALTHDGHAVQLVSEANLIDGKLIKASLGIVKDKKLVMGKQSYPLTDIFVGSIEKIALTPSGQSERVDGWALDGRTKSAVRGLVAVRGTDIVAKSLPTILREERTHQAKDKSRPTGFSMLVPLAATPTQAREKLRLIALLADGKAATLKN